MSSAAKVAYGGEPNRYASTKWWQIMLGVASVMNVVFFVYLGFENLNIAKSDSAVESILERNIEELTEQKSALQTEITEIAQRRNRAEEAAVASQNLADLRSRELTGLNLSVANIQAQVQAERELLERVTAERDDLIREKLLTDLGSNFIYLPELSGNRLSSYSYTLKNDPNSRYTGMFDEWRHPIRHYYPLPPDETHKRVMAAVAEWLAVQPIEHRAIADSIFLAAEQNCRPLRDLAPFEIPERRPVHDGNESIEQVIELLEAHNIGVVDYDWSDGTSDQHKLSKYRDDLISGYIFLFNERKRRYLYTIRQRFEQCLGLSQHHVVVDHDVETVGGRWDSDQDFLAANGNSLGLLFREDLTERDPNNRAAIKVLIASRLVNVEER